MHALEYTRRLDAATAAMADAGLDGLVVAGRGLLTQYGHLQYLAGYCPVIRPGALLLRRAAPPILALSTPSDLPLAAASSPLRDVRIAPPGDDGAGGMLARLIAEAMAGATAAPPRIGVVGLEDIVAADELRRWQAALPDAAFLPATHLLLALKAVKTAEEVDRMRAVAAGADDGFEALAAALSGGAGFRAAAGAAEACIRAGGAHETLVYCSAGPHFLHRPLAGTPTRGDLLTVFVELSDEAGYWVELARLVAFGPLDAARRRAVERSEAALAAAERTLRAGLACGTVYAAVADAIGPGFASGLSFGHGVGVDHDLPSLGKGEPATLQPGMTVAVHPHILDIDGAAGACLCDTFEVTQAGARPLSRLSRTPVTL